MNRRPLLQGARPFADAADFAARAVQAMGPIPLTPLERDLRAALAGLLKAAGPAVPTDLQASAADLLNRTAGR